MHAGTVARPSRWPSFGIAAMFDFDSGKFLIVGIVALILVGPKDLPRLFRALGRIIAKMRGLQTTLQDHLNDLVKEADIDGVERQLKAETWLDIARDPKTAMRGRLPSASAPAAAAPAATDELDYASKEMRDYLASS